MAFCVGPKHRGSALPNCLFAKDIWQHTYQMTLHYLVPCAALLMSVSIYWVAIVISLAALQTLALNSLCVSFHFSGMCSDTSQLGG